jgi:hypothetical protein
MPRSNRSRRPRRAPRSEPGQGIDRDRALFGTARTERRRGADWIVRPVSAADAVKAYRCPGCNQDIRPATAHVVAVGTGTAPAGTPTAGGERMFARLDPRQGGQ